MFYAKVIAAAYSLMFLADLSAGATTPAIGNVYDRYAIPRDKRTIKSCEQAALAAVPGHLENFQVRNTRTGFIYQFEIETRNRLKFSVICDAATQQILKTQTLTW